MLAITSLYLCADRLCPDEDLVSGLRALNETCQTSYNSSLPSFDLIAGYTEEDFARIPKIDPADHPPKGSVAEVVLPSGPLFKLASDTLVQSSHYIWAMHENAGSWGHACANVWTSRL